MKGKQRNNEYANKIMSMQKNEQVSKEVNEWVNE